MSASIINKIKNLHLAMYIKLHVMMFNKLCQSIEGTHVLRADPDRLPGDSNEKHRLNPVLRIFPFLEGFFLFGGGSST